MHVDSVDVIIIGYHMLPRFLHRSIFFDLYGCSPEDISHEATTSDLHSGALSKIQNLANSFDSDAVVSPLSSY